MNVVADPIFGAARCATATAVGDTRGIAMTSVVPAVGAAAGAGRDIFDNCSSHRTGTNALVACLVAFEMTGTGTGLGMAATHTCNLINECVKCKLAHQFYAHLDLERLEPERVGVWPGKLLC